MEFGKLADISGVNFTLPADNPLTEKVLSSANEAAPLRVFVGPPAWSDKSWVGKVYPSNAKEREFLHYFTHQFNTIELNLTHYKMPTHEMVSQWKREAAAGFEFCPKFPQTISHERKLIGAEAETAQFCYTLLELGEHLGRTFLQLPPTYQPNQFKNLVKYLKSLPEGFPVSVEFRHEKWFSNPDLWQETCGVLQEMGVGTVITDVAGRRDVLHMTLTTNHLMLRFIGNELHPTDFSRTDEWCLRIKDWIAKGLKNIYVFIHCYYNKNAPELTHYWVKKLNETCNLRIQEPRITPRFEQGSLF